MLQPSLATRETFMIRPGISAAAFVALALAVPLRAQIVLPNQGETLPAFEVDTVKASSRDLGQSFRTHIWWNDNSYRTENTTLRDLIRAAFGISDAQLDGGNEKAQLDARWDIKAKVADDEFARLNKLPSDDRNRAFHLMQQALLGDRFGLKFHTETRELPVFDLVVDKSGSKLQPATPTDNDGFSINVGHTNATMHATAATVSMLADMLGRQSELDGRLVIDKTGLAGKYNWSLQWQPQRLTATASPDATGPSLFTALKEQLGLKLESSKGPVQVVVVDTVSLPTPN